MEPVIRRGCKSLLLKLLIHQEWLWVMTITRSVSGREGAEVKSNVMTHSEGCLEKCKRNHRIRDIESHLNVIPLHQAGTAAPCFTPNTAGLLAALCSLPEVRAVHRMLSLQFFIYQGECMICLCVHNNWPALLRTSAAHFSYALLTLNTSYSPLSIFNGYKKQHNNLHWICLTHEFRIVMVPIIETEKD